MGRAAQRLRIAQPAISRHVRALEDEVGARLFERTPRGMTLLPPGRVFFEHAQAILAAVDRAVVAIRAEAGATDGDEAEADDAAEAEAEADDAAEATPAADQ